MIVSWQSAAEGWVPPDVDMRTPSVARMYDYYLGGKDNIATDRAAADEAMRVVPHVGAFARQNRAFLGRVVHFLAGRGVRQFIDIGTGLPSQGHVHEVAAHSCPDARIVYVDNDPVVLAHARALIPPRAGITVIDADMREPGSILLHPDTRRLIDFAKPVAVLLIAMLHFAPDTDDPASLADAFVAEMAPGSFLALSHLTSDGPPAYKVQEIEDIYRDTAAPLTFRSRTEIAGLFCGLDIVRPGLVQLPEWRPVAGEVRLKSSPWLLGGVARKSS